MNSYACPLCDSSNYNLLYDKARHGKNVNNYICEGCGFIFVLPRLSRKDLDNLYINGGFSKNERKLEKPNDKKFAQCENIANSRFETLIKHLGHDFWRANSNKAILEVGCGTGSFLRLMRGAGWKVFGLEPDSTYLEAVEERYGLTIENKLVENYCSNEIFDVISSFHVIEHVSDPNIFLKSIYKLLKTDGLIYLECPSIDRWYGESIDFIFWDVHINTFSETTLKSFMLKNGFEPLDSGWHGNELWVIAKKVKVVTIPAVWDNPKRIKGIVQEAENKSGARFSEIDKSSRLLSTSRRAFALATQSPLQIPAKGLRKVTRYFKLSANTLNAQDIALKPDKVGVNYLRIAHVGDHGNGNAGDTLLFPAVRWLFQKEVAPTHFCNIPLRAPVTQETIDRINQQDALVIGGGGLFLADTNANEQSGWQWACPLELLEQIKVPIIVFAVGYNRFRGQEEFSPIFEKSVQRLIEKSAFVGIRNRGSIEALKVYLPESLHENIHYQPCPTTILRHFYPDLPQYQETPKPTLAVNIAFDRHHLRFGHREDEILWSMADAFLELERQGWTIKLFNHLPLDNNARFWFRARGLFAEEVNIGIVPPIEILREYSQVTIAAGMRGHAQMIPFGLNRPIYSLISHNKLQFFLADIKHPNWGVEVQDPNLPEKLVRDINSLYTNLPEIENQLKTAQSELWKITLQNLEIIKKSLNV